MTSQQLERIIAENRPDTRELIVGQTFSESFDRVAYHLGFVLITVNGTDWTITVDRRDNTIVEIDQGDFT